MTSTVRDATVGALNVCSCMPLRLVVSSTEHVGIPVPRLCQFQKTSTEPS